MTKQQAISMKLAQWLHPTNSTVLALNGHIVTMPADLHSPAVEFNPFANSTEGRAQFAECWLKAKVDRVPVDHYFDDDRRIAYQVPCQRRWRYVTHEDTAQGLVDATLEAIFYAIGGTADAWHHTKGN